MASVAPLSLLFFDPSLLKWASPGNVDAPLQWHASLAVSLVHLWYTWYLWHIYTVRKGKVYARRGSLPPPLFRVTFWAVTMAGG